VEANPENVDALHLLGALLNQRGRFAAAVDMIERAVRCRPTDPVLRHNLGNALKDAGRPTDAEESYRQAVKQLPDFADAHSNLGCLLHSLGRFAEAEQSLRQALAFEPRHAFAHNYLGMVLGDLGQLEEAVQSLRRALAIQPHYSHAHHNLGIALMELQQTEEAEQCYRKALALVPHFAAIHNDLGDALWALGRWEEAEQSYRQALALQPALAAAHVGIGNVLKQRAQLKEAEYTYREALKLGPALARAHSNLGLTLFESGRPEEAEQCYVQALALEPERYSAHDNYAYVLMRVGRLEEAERSYRRALALKPTLAATHSNLALLLNYIPGRAAAEIYAEHCEFGRRFRQPDPVRPHGNTPDPERRLRIGYVSADLRHHSVAFFIAPVLSQHDERASQVICYYNGQRSDATTQRLKADADLWRDVFGLKDDALADLIRQDAIDILVDLGGHTANNRLLTFARKPAPVQATWLGYLNTTGLEAMDWRIADARAAPEGLFDSLHSEKLLRLPYSQWCYEPPDRCPAVVPPPSTRAEGCTFGAFSIPAKINARVIEVWSRLLRSVPRSRLLVVTNNLTSIPADYPERFTRQGIDPKRVDLVPSKAFDD
jgi:predicted O-linked N-acetylglucosamine transferase (SPINDLY family)